MMLLEKTRHGKATGEQHMAVPVRAELSASYKECQTPSSTSSSKVATLLPHSHPHLQPHSQYKKVYSLSKLNHGSARLWDTESGINSWPETGEMNFNLIQTKLCFLCHIYHKKTEGL